MKAIIIDSISNEHQHTIINSIQSELNKNGLEVESVIPQVRTTK